MLHLPPRSGFTMLEMLLVIAILAIAIVMSRPLFQNPNQDIIESEVCINTLSSTLESFFLNATLGKSMPGVRAQDGTLHPGEKPDLYVIGLNLVKPAGRGSAIDFYTFASVNPPGGGGILSSYTINTHESIDRSEFTNFSNCRQDNKYNIILSTNIKTTDDGGPMPKPIDPVSSYTRAAKNRILIALSPHDHSFASGGMSILHTTQALCYSGPCPSPTPDKSINHHYASFILTYNFCAKDPYKSDDPYYKIESNCLPLYKTKFDTRSQTIKHSKCLHYKKHDNTCTKWSVNFDEGIIF